jgi:hypothetical protein
MADTSDRLFFARDFRPRRVNAEWIPGARCWFLVAQSLEEAEEAMELFRTAEMDRECKINGWNRYDERRCMSDKKIAEILNKPSMLVDPHECAAWVSRVEGQQMIYDEEHNIWTYVLPDEDGNAHLINPLSMGYGHDAMFVTEISVENGFRQEEIDIGWKRALYSRLSAE